MVILKWLIQFKLVIGATAVKINKQTGNHGDCIFRFCVTPVELPSFFSCRIIDFQFDKIKRTLLYLMSSCLLCCWKWVFAMTSAFSRQNSVSLCPTLFCSSRPNFPVTPDISFPYFIKFEHQNFRGNTTALHTESVRVWHVPSKLCTLSMIDTTITGI